MMPLGLSRLSCKNKMLTLLEGQFGERQIDIALEQAQDMRPIVAVAYKTGIKLQ